MRLAKESALALMLIIVMLTIIEVKFLFFETSFGSVSGVETAYGIGVYWDENCSSRAYSIDWGVLSPGGVKNVVVYVRNEGDESLLLNFTTVNWNPDDASRYLNFSWSSKSDRIKAGETVKVVQTLSAFPYVMGISSFSFDIILEGVVYSKLAIIGVKPYRTILENNTFTSINVTVEYRGDTAETFNITAYYHTNKIGSQTLTTSKEETRTLTFKWNTTGVQLGNYTIKATASQLPEEINLADNIFIFGNITISMSGDINADKIVNILDIGMAAKAFGTKPGDEKFNSNADVNEDTEINIIDIGNIAKEYGVTL